MSTGWHKQRALESRMFGPAPKERKRRARRVPPPPEEPRFVIGNCPMCGGHVECLDPYTCSFCGQSYAAVTEQP